MKNAVKYGALLCILLWCGCSDTQKTTSDPRAALIESLGKTVILPMHKDVAQTAKVLEQATTTLCKMPSSQALALAQEAWWNNRASLKHVEVFAFGPYVEAPLRFGPTLDFYPARASSIESVLAEDPIPDQKMLSTRGVTQRGSPVIEYLLYAPDGELSALESIQQKPARCAYLNALVADHMIQSTGLYEAWAPEQGNFIGQLTTPEGGAYSDRGMVVAELANRMAFIIENIRKDKLSTPLGKSAQGSPQPELVESRFSDRSVQDILDNLSVVYALFYGDFNGVDGLGFDDVLRGQGSDFGPRFEAQYNQSISALSAIKKPLDEAITTDPQLVDDAYAQLRELQRLIQADMLNALGIPGTFNDNDGD